MPLPQPTKTRIIYCNISGADITVHVRSIKVFETVCKPYITATLEILDKNNVINNLQLVGSEPVNFAFYGNQNRIYEAQLRVLSVKSETSAQNLRSLPYTIECIGQAYFNDRVNLVQQSFQGITATDAIQKIHGQYVGGDAPLSILTSSLGLLTNELPYIVNSIKPFKAIDDIRANMNFAQYSTGNSLYYRNRDQYVLTALEHLFARLSPQQEFIQSETWGIDINNYALAERSILAAKAEMDSTGAEGNRGHVGDLASSLVQSKTVFDMRELVRTVNTFATSISSGQVVGTPLGDMVSSILKGKILGGEPNHQLFNSFMSTFESTAAAKTERERLYSATAKGGPRMTVKVPIQSGSEVTVGQGVKLNLVPPLGDLKSGINLISGNWLTIDICHEVVQSATGYTGTSTIRCIRGGYD